uniref:Uncharacterized protein n=1 Tax=Schistosoma mansoni TaxID=6183 RepID=A0A5K4F1F1_SCHMA
MEEIIMLLVWIVVIKIRDSFLDIKLATTYSTNGCQLHLKVNK